MNRSDRSAPDRFGVALLRVSTDRQFQEGESIETQKRKVELVARRERIDIVRFFTEHYSGRKTDRRVLEDLFLFLTENRDVECVVVGDIDRVTRGGSEVYLALKRRLRDLDVHLIDTTGIIQPERNRLEHLGVEYAWSVESPSRYAEVFMAEKARVEASDILTRTIGQQVQLTRDGYQCRGANYGYRNVKIITDDGKRKTTLEPHPDEARFAIRMFELKADGGWTDEAICDHLDRMGYGSRPMNIYDPNTRRVMGKTQPQKLTPKQLNRYVSRTIYCGVRLERWNDGRPVLAPIAPLVSIELFNRANRGKVRIVEHNNGRIEVVEDRIKQDTHRHNPDFLLRHVVACDLCGKPFMASRSKGKSGKYFGYYHCSRGHKHHAINKARFEETIAKCLDSLEAKPGFLPLFREVVRDVWISKLRTDQDDTAMVKEHIRMLKARQSALIDRLTSTGSAIVQQKLEAEIEECEATIRSAEAALNKQAVKDDDIDGFFAIAKKLLEHPRNMVFCAETKPRLEKIWGFIFKSRPGYQNLVTGTPELSLLYRLNRDIGPDEGQLAGQLSRHWNTFEAEVEEAINTFGYAHKRASLFLDQPQMDEAAGRLRQAE